MDSTFTFDTTKPFQYQLDGKHLESSSLTLYAPSYKTRTSTNILKQLFFRAAKSFDSSSNTNSKNKADDNETISPEDIILMLYASSVDISQVFDAFEKILLSGHCKIANEIELRQHHLECMDTEDVEKILGRYLSDFLLASWMSKLTNNS